MTNYKFGLCSAYIAASATVIFAISMLINDKLLSYGICMVLSWSYINLTCVFTAQANQNKKALAYAGMVFACIYAIFVNLVYFTQLTTVNQHAASGNVLKILTFEPGSWLFALDIFGYGMMAISTLFIGMTIMPENITDKWLKALLMIHGIFAPICVIFPVLNLFSSAGNVEQGSNIGMLALEGWCLFFIPTMILTAKYFKDKIKKPGC